MHSSHQSAHHDNDYERVRPLPPRQRIWWYNFMIRIKMWILRLHKSTTGWSKPLLIFLSKFAKDEGRCNPDLNQPCVRVLLPCQIVTLRWSCCRMHHEWPRCVFFLFSLCGKPEVYKLTTPSHNNGWVKQTLWWLVIFGLVERFLSSEGRKANVHLLTSTLQNNYK